MGHVSQSLVLSAANKPLSARRLASVLATSSKLEIDFCRELNGLQPFHCLSCECMCLLDGVCACIHVCLPLLSVYEDNLGFVCLNVFADAISVIEFRLFAACGCPSVKGDFCPPNVAP